MNEDILKFIGSVERLADSLLDQYKKESYLKCIKLSGYNSITEILIKIFNVIEEKVIKDSGGFKNVDISLLLDLNSNIPESEYIKTLPKQIQDDYNEYGDSLSRIFTITIVSEIRKDPNNYQLGIDILKEMRQYFTNINSDISLINSKPPVPENILEYLDENISNIEDISIIPKTTYWHLGFSPDLLNKLYGLLLSNNLLEENLKFLE